MSLVVTGCQRSGTGYISIVLSAAGHWCAHERHYRMDTKKVPGGLVEASHMALPLLTDETVAWQVRHPLAVAASMLARGTLRPSRQPPSGKWILRQLPQVRREPSHLERVLRYWHDWNRRVQERAHLGWRVERVTVADLSAALHTAGMQPDDDRLAAALDLVPAGLHSTSHDGLSWDDVPHGAARRDAEALAGELGYR